MGLIFFNDLPRVFDSKNDKAQTIHFKEQGVTLDLDMIGPVPFLSIRKPTKQELEECMWLELTSTHEWNPDCLTTAGVCAIDLWGSFDTELDY